MSLRTWSMLPPRSESIRAIVRSVSTPDGPLHSGLAMQTAVTMNNAPARGTSEDIILRTTAATNVSQLDKTVEAEATKFPSEMPYPIVVVQVVLGAAAILTNSDDDGKVTGLQQFSCCNARSSRQLVLSLRFRSLFAAKLFGLSPCPLFWGRLRYL